LSNRKAELTFNSKPKPPGKVNSFTS
jgi:hypothetical protein